MKGILPALIVAVAFADGCQAAESNNTFPAGTSIPASVTLLPLSGKIGRDNPFFSGYRPELRSANARSGVSCAVDLGNPDMKVLPGETRPAVLRCLEPLVVKRLPGHFDLYEGGRKVGTASIGE